MELPKMDDPPNSAPRDGNLQNSDLQNSNLHSGNAQREAARSIQRVALVGTGPAGTSLALAWKKARPELSVIGLDAPGALSAAEDLGALDEKAASLEAATRGADLVVLAGRLPAALRQLEEMAPHLAAGTLVTDTGAAKQPIARHAADVLPEGISFIGGHPVASGEHATATTPSATRFDGGTYLLCPSRHATDSSAAGSSASGSDAPGDEAPSVAALRERFPSFLALVEATGARVEVLSATRHDCLCAVARDLPVLLGATLARVASAEEHHETLHALCPPAVRPLIWGREELTAKRREELVAGEGALLDALGRYVRALQEARRHLAAGDIDAALRAGEDEERG